MPNFVSVAVKMYTANRGKSFRGRTYWIGLDQGAILQNSLQSATATAILNALNALQTDLSGMTPSCELCVLSRFHNKLKRDNGIGTAVLGFTFVDMFLDTQRRRAPAHNRHR